MEQKKFEAILILLCQQVISEIIANESLSETDATNKFYTSSLYETLENEKTKLWHLSPKALYELYNEEQTTGKITYPEEA